MCCARKFKVVLRSWVELGYVQSAREVLLPRCLWQQGPPASPDPSLWTVSLKMRSLAALCESRASVCMDDVIDALFCGVLC